MIVDGYVRVSQVAGREGDAFISPSVQRQQIERWAEGHDAFVAEVFEELDESGGRRDRPLLGQAIRRVEDGASDGLVVAYMSRFGRSLLDGLLAIKRITDAGGSFVSVQDGVDFATDTGRFLLRHMLSVAEWELDRFRSNWRVASERAVGRGLFLGATPFGYYRAKDGRLRPDPLTGRIASELFRRRADGARHADLMRWLMDIGVKTATGKTVWCHGSVACLFRCRAYLGESRYGAVVNRSAHPPLTDLESWERAQFRGLRLPAKHDHETPLLWGLLRCDHCQRVLGLATHHSGTSAAVRIYHCRGYDCPSPVYITDALIEPYIEALMWQLLPERPRRVTKPPRVARLEEAVERRERELVAYRDNPHLPVTLGDKFAEGVQVRLHRAERARMELRQARRAAKPPKVPTGRELKAQWPTLTAEQRRDMIAEVIDCAFVWRGKGNVEARTFVFRRGRAPADLPNLGRGYNPPCEPFDPSRFARPVRLRATPDWSEARLRKELEAFVSGMDCWPSFPEFQAAGRAGLYGHVERHGGPRRWTRLLDLPFAAPAPGGTVWSDDRMRAALTDFLDGRTQWPAYPDFKAAGQTALRNAVAANGGVARWADEMGVELPLQRRSPQRWPYARMKEEVRRLAQGRGEWPRHAEFKAAGLDGLYQTISKTGMRERLGAELGLAARPPQRGRTSPWTDEEIRGALDQLLAGRNSWPSRREFREANLRSLWDHITASGKRDWWAEQYALQPPPVPRVWATPAIEGALDKLLNGRGSWPTRAEFDQAGLSGLWDNIYRNGTRENWMRQYNLPARSGRRGPPATGLPTQRPGR